MEEITSLQKRLVALEPSLNISAKRERLVTLQRLNADPKLWEEQASAVSQLAEQTELSKLLQQWDETRGLLDISEQLSEADARALNAEIEALERLALLSGPHDAQNALLTVHAGTGGVDAQDWAAMLQRMFLRFVESGKTESLEERTLAIDRHNWKATVIEENKGEEAGIKKVVIEVQGSYAFGLLKNEAGVHRLVRLSPFNAKNLRQTSFALIEVIPEIEQGSNVQINEDELKIDVYRSGGHGGQGVNTTDSAVRITHIPTGIVVTVQNERSQHQNKATAMKILESKLARLKEVANAQEVAMLKGEFKEGSWGNQIRSYVLQPYQMVKDHRSEYETSNTSAVLDGEIGSLITANLLRSDKLSA